MVARKVASKVYVYLCFFTVIYVPALRGIYAPFFYRISSQNTAFQSDVGQCSFL